MSYFHLHVTCLVLRNFMNVLFGKKKKTTVYREVCGSLKTNYFFKKRLENRKD